MNVMVKRDGMLYRRRGPWAEECGKYNGQVSEMEEGGYFLGRRPLMSAPFVLFYY